MDRAIEQAKQRVAGGLGARISGDTGGRPMVVTFSEMLDPKNFDLDYELEKRLVTQWLHDNYDKIKDKLVPSKSDAGIVDIIKQNREQGIMSSGIVTKSAQGLSEIYAGTPSNITEGAIIGQIMARLGQQDPELVDTFESELFKKPLGLVLKYVGSTPLKPTDFTTFANGGSTSAQDTVPALLTPGEFVINKKAAKKIGPAQLNKMNKADKIQGFNKGGAVQKFINGGSPVYGPTPPPPPLPSRNAPPPLPSPPSPPPLPKVLQQQLEFFALKAKQAGSSLEQYQRQLAKQTAQLSKDLQTDLGAKKQDLQYAAVNAGAGLKGRSRTGSDEDKIFIKKAEDLLLSKLQAIIPDQSRLKELETAAASLVDKMITNGGSFEDASKQITAVGEAMNKTLQPAEATAEAMQIMSEKTGVAVEILDRQIGDLVKQRETTFGNFKNDAKDVVDSLGGPIRIVGSVMTILGDQTKKLIVSLDSNTKQNVALMTTMGGFIGAAQGMVAGQVVGSEGKKIFEKLFPDSSLGKRFEMAATAAGAFIGAVNGAADAFHRAQLDTVLTKVSDSATKVDTAFDNLSRNKTPQAFNEAQQSLKDFSGEMMGLVDQANLGAGGASRTTLEWMRGLDPTGMTSSISGQATEQEARNKLVADMSSIVDRAKQLGEIRMGQVSGTAIQKNVEQTQGFNAQISALEKGGGSKEEIDAVKKQKAEFLSTSSQVFGQLRQLYKTDSDAFLALWMDQQQKSGKMTSEQIADALKTPEGVQKAIAEGQRLSASYAEQEQRARLLADASRSVVIQTENILNIYRLLEANLVRFGQTIGDIKDDAMNAASAYKGQAAIRPSKRADQRVFENISAYSTNEVKAAAARTGALAGGGDKGAQFERRIVGAKAIKDVLPKILQETTSANVEDVMDKLADKFDKLGLEIDTQVFTQLKETLAGKLTGQRQGASAGELSEDPALLEAVSKVSEETLKAAANLNKAFYDAVDSVTELSNEYSKALQEATEFQLKANDIRLKSEVQLAETLGQNLSLQELNAPQESRIRGLTASNVLPGGSIDPKQIYDSMERMIGDRKNQEQELAKRSADLRAATGDEERKRAKEAVDEQVKYMAEQNAAINNSRQALEELAGDGSAAANALNKLAEQQKLAQGSVNFMEKVLTSTPTELIDMQKQLGSYTRMVSGQASNREIGNVQFRQRAFAGANMLQGVLPENIQRQMQAKMSREMISRMPGGQNLLQQTTGALNPDGSRMTMDQALNITETGRDPIQEQYLAEYAAATQRQADAADSLGAAATAVGDKFAQSATAILEAVQTQLPQEYGKAVTDATPEPQPVPAGPEATDSILPEKLDGAISILDTMKTQDAESSGKILASLGGLAGAIVAGLVGAGFGGGGKEGGGGGIVGDILGKVQDKATDDLSEAIYNKVKDKVTSMFKGGGAGGAGGGAGGAGWFSALLKAAAVAEVGRGIYFGATEQTSTNQEVTDLMGDTAGTAFNAITGGLAGNTGQSQLATAAGIDENASYAQGAAGNVLGSAEAAGRGAAIGYQFGGPTGALVGAIAGLAGDIAKNGALLTKALYDTAVQANSNADMEAQYQAKEKQIRENRNSINKEEFSAQTATALSALSAPEQTRAKDEAQLQIALKQAKAIQEQGGTIEDINPDMRGNFSSIDELITSLETRAQNSAQQRANIDVSAAGDWTTTRRGADSPEFTAAVDAMVQEQENNSTNLEKVGSMADEATKPGSIYTHDIHLEKLLGALLGKPPVDVEDISTETSKDMNIGEISDKIKQGLSAAQGVLSNPQEAIQKAVASLNSLTATTPVTPQIRGAGDAPAPVEDKTKANMTRARRIAILGKDVDNRTLEDEMFLENTRPKPQTKPTQLSPYEQMLQQRKQAAEAQKGSRRQQYLSRFRPEVRAGMMTDAEKGISPPTKEANMTKARRIAILGKDVESRTLEDEMFLENTKPKPQPRNAAYTTSRQPPLTQAASPAAAMMGATLNQPLFRPGMTREQSMAMDIQEFPMSARTAPVPSNKPETSQNTTSTATNQATNNNILSMEEKTNQFLTSLTNTVSSFGTYVTNLEKATANIPDKIDLVIQAEPIEVKITGGAVLDALKSVPDFLQKMVNDAISSKTKGLRDLWNATGGDMGTNPRGE